MAKSQNNEELKESISLTSMLSDQYRNYVEQVEKSGQMVGNLNSTWKDTSKLIEEYNDALSANKDIYEDQSDLLKQQLKDTEKLIATISKKSKLNEGDKKTVLAELKVQKDKYNSLIQQRKVQDTITSKANGMLDGLESQIKKVPIVGDLLASTLDFGGLKKEMGGIIGGITQNFTTLKAGGMGTGKAIGKSFMKAIPQVAAFGATLWAAIAPLLPIILPIIAALYILKKAFAFSSQVTELARDLGVSNDEAREMSHSFNQIAADSNDLSINSAALLGSQM